MDRKNFLKKSVLGLGAAAAVPAVVGTASAKDTSTYTQLMQQVGFNHLPNKEEKTMKTVLHKATSRGHANHGWLDTHHSFSFANYHNPERMHFGVLRVLNDDVVAGGRGFGMHPHDNMEIISIPLKGGLEHQDNTGNKHEIRENDIQVMSAGKGIFHAEYNRDKDNPTNFLQIWIFPNKKNVEPRYDQLNFKPESRKNKLQQILSPTPDDEGVWIHQDAWFHRGNLDKDTQVIYDLRKEGNGIYLFVLEGEVTVEGQALQRRDGFGLWDTGSVAIKADEAAEVLVMEVPMQL